MKLFIDDERYPTYPVDKIARSSQEAIYWLEANGFPKFISFDHDLGMIEGKPDTVMPFIDWFIEEWLLNRLDIPKDFEYRVHSQNIVGARNIAGKMESFLKMVRG